MKEWLVNGVRHRVDGPAYIYADGTQNWYQDGKLHRVDGPAIIWADGSEEWWVNGREIDILEWSDRFKKKPVQTLFCRHCWRSRRKSVTF